MLQPLKDMAHLGKVNCEVNCESQVVILDGSMGNYIRSSDIPQDEGSLFTKIWSAAALVLPEYHETIIKAHMEYIKCGSEIISTNSYAIQPNYYQKAFGCHKYEDLMLSHAKLAAQLADTARSRSHSNDKVRIFGALGPICESHHPGKFEKYVTENGSNFCVNTYENIALSLLEGGVDGFLVETMNCWKETYLALEGVKNAMQNNRERGNNMPIIVSLQGSLRNDALQPSPLELGPVYVRNFLKYFDENPSLNIVAFGLNCADAEDILSSFQSIFGTKIYLDDTKKGPCYEYLAEAFKLRNIKVVAYPNLNDASKLHREGYDVSKGKFVKQRKDMVDDDHKGFSNLMETLVKRFGVSYVGGCCGCSPNGIKKLYEKFRL